MKKNDIILLLATTAILAFSWISFSVYHNSVKSTIGEALKIQIAPIEPQFNTKVIEDLGKRTPITPILEAEKPATPSGLSASPSATPEASPSATGVVTP